MLNSSPCSGARSQGCRGGGCSDRWPAITARPAGTGGRSWALRQRRNRLRRYCDAAGRDSSECSYGPAPWSAPLSILGLPWDMGTCPDDASGSGRVDVPSVTGRLLWTSLMRRSIPGRSAALMDWDSGTHPQQGGSPVHGHCVPLACLGASRSFFGMQAYIDGRLCGRFGNYLLPVCAPAWQPASRSPASAACADAGRQKFMALPTSMCAIGRTSLLGHPRDASVTVGRAGHGCTGRVHRPAFTGGPPQVCARTKS